MSAGIGLADLLLSRSDANYVNRYTYLVTEDNKHEFLYVDRIYKRYMGILLSKSPAYFYADADGHMPERATFCLRLDVPNPENVMDVLEREYKFIESQEREKKLAVDVIDFNRVDDNAKLIKIAMKAEHLINNHEQIKNNEDIFTKNFYYIVG